MQRILRLFGLPENLKLKDIASVISDFRFVLYIYIILVTIYITFFIFYRDCTISWLDDCFGSGFGISYSSSFLEDLVFFLSIGLIVTFISAISSLKRLDEFSPVHKLSAIINSDFAKNDMKVFDFLQSSMLTYLAYNREINYSITLREFHEAENCFLIVPHRKIYLTNMCKDVVIEKKHVPLEIDATTQINNNYGQLHFFHTFDPLTGEKIHKDCEFKDFVKLNRDKTTRHFPIEVKENSEVGIEFEYSIYLETGDKSNLEKYWHHFESSRFTRKLIISLENVIKEVPVEFQVRLKRHGEENLTDIPLWESKLLINNKISKELDVLLRPGDCVFFYFSPILA